MDAGEKEGACAEVKEERIKGLCSTANSYYLFNLLLRVICQTVVALPAPPALVQHNEQPEKKIICFWKDHWRGRVDDNGPEKWGSCIWITSQDPNAVCTPCTQEMRLINTYSQGQWKDHSHDDGETGILPACFLRQVAGHQHPMLWATMSMRLSRVGGRVFPPRKEDVDLTLTDTKLTPQSAKGQKEGKQSDNIMLKWQRKFLQ